MSFRKNRWVIATAAWLVGVWVYSAISFRPFFDEVWTAVPWRTAMEIFFWRPLFVALGPLELVMALLSGNWVAMADRYWRDPREILLLLGHPAVVIPLVAWGIRKWRKKKGETRTRQQVVVGPGLEAYAPSLEKETREAMALVGSFIRLSDELTVKISNDPTRTVAEVGGFCGYTPHAHEVQVSLDPTNARFQDGLARKELTRTLVHELHHSARWVDPGYGDTLFDALVTEGLADHFLCQVTGEAPEPWAVSLSDDALASWLEKARPSFDDETYSHEDWFFGCAEKGMPKWLGYALGYEIVKRYLAAYPGETAARLVNANSDNFLAST